LLQSNTPVRQQTDVRLTPYSSSSSGMSALEIFSWGLIIVGGALVIGGLVMYAIDMDGSTTPLFVSLFGAGAMGIGATTLGI